MTHNLVVGQQLGKYRLLRLLGRGGFADVYLGEHINLKNYAAIKVLQAQLAGNDRDLFLREAQIVARLEHPHIVRIMDFEVQKGIPFLVMSYLPNKTLRERHTRGTRLPLSTIVPYVKQVADALQYAHDEKVVHRDIKPENMLIGRRNEIVLSDFGIAIEAMSSRYQSPQNVAGTIAYIAPEQLQGHPRPASDQYALAILVYEWLCGQRPFQGTAIEVTAQHIATAPPPLRSKVPSISPDLEEVVLVALAKDPKQRFKNIQAFARALEQAANGMSPITQTRQAVPQTTGSIFEDIKTRLSGKKRQSDEYVSKVNEEPISKELFYRTCYLMPHYISYMLQYLQKQMAFSHLSYMQEEFNKLQELRHLHQGNAILQHAVLNDLEDDIVIQLEMATALGKRRQPAFETYRHAQAHLQQFQEFLGNNAYTTLLNGYPLTSEDIIEIFQIFSRRTMFDRYLRETQNISIGNWILRLRTDKKFRIKRIQDNIF